MNQPSQAQEIAAKINEVTNVLVVVSDSPTVDALSAALGFTVYLNNLNKHATAIFSGKVPPAITFLDPTKTFEVNTDSLRDFIIALDKEKADHLRYKLEDDMVKIFITPYRTTITQEDLRYSMGDYNVELVIALGVSDPNHLDTALQAHGKILHDATVVSISSHDVSSTIGSLNWNDPATSSLSEMVVSITDILSQNGTAMDKQIATALLTGIVAETERFSNANTTSQSMVVAAKLMASGADQQLIAAQLEEDHEVAPDTALPEAVQATLQPVTPSLNALENALQGGLIVDHAPKTLEQLTKEIKADDVREDVMFEEPIAQLDPQPISELKPAIQETSPPTQDTKGTYLETGSNDIPTSGAMVPEIKEPSVDIYNDPLTASEIKSQQSSPAPTQTEPVADEAAALDAAKQAFDQAATQVEPVSIQPSISLPMPPSVPDFSQLPPPPTGQPLVLGSEHNSDQVADPSQFRIPS